MFFSSLCWAQGPGALGPGALGPGLQTPDSLPDLRDLLLPQTPDSLPDLRDSIPSLKDLEPKTLRGGESLVLEPNARRIVTDGTLSAEALATLLGSDPSNAQQWQDAVTVSGPEVQELLAKTQEDVWQALKAGEPAIVDLDRLGDEFAIPPEVLSRGVESYALYDNTGEFIKLVFVPWNANADSVISAAARDLAKGWRHVRVFFKAAGKVILNLKEKIDAALTQVKEWACSVQPQPDSVSVTVEGQFDLQVASFGGSTGITYSTQDLCDGSSSSTADGSRPGK